MTDKVSEGFAKRAARTAREAQSNGGRASRPPPLVLSAQTALELKRRQTAEIYRAMPASMVLSYIGTIFAFVLFYTTGDAQRGIYWFAYATGVLFFRATAIWHYAQEDVIKNPDRWANLLIAGNVLAGIQWGLVGTWLFVADPVYRALFSVIAVIGYVGGSVVPFSPVKFAHAALAVPAALPTAIYIFFIRADGSAIVGAISIFLLASIIYMGEMQYKIIRARLLSEMENEQYRRDAEQSTTSLGVDLQKLEHRAMVVKRAQIEARRRAETLSRHIETTLLPVMECDQDGRIIEWNQAAEATFGYQHSELAGLTLNNLVASVEPKTTWAAFFETTLNLKKSGAMDVFVRAHDGRPYAVRLYVTPIDIDGDASKKAGRAAIIVTNIPTELAVRRAEKLAGNQK